jgi:tRNA U34 5-methylaminomethyl-2-thiouridine-forming methyltransferase MnmC
LNNLVLTSDGSHTIFVPELNEHYHSVHGAVQESELVFMKNGFDFSKEDPLYIFEAGFGTGLNALLTAARAENTKRKVIYTTIEKYPLGDNIIQQINYAGFAGLNGKKLFGQIHSAGWGKMTVLTENFSILKIHGDLITDEIPGQYNLIFFDAFGPDKQPDIWSEPVFRKISAATKEGGVFVTYSAKGVVKRMLRSCGFTVSLLPGPPGKREMIRAVKHP